jgi:hypothetical protein
MESPAASNTPIVCDMTDASDTAEERMAEYGRLFAQSLTGRERTDGGIRLRFRADHGVEAWIADLVAREKLCCPFFDFAVSTTGGEVWWEISVGESVVDQGIARAILDEYFNAPDTVADGVAGMEDRFRERGWKVTTNASGTVRQAHPTSADG